MKNQMNNLNFRFTTEKHGSLTASTTDEQLNARLLKAATQLVVEAFDKMHLPNAKSDGRTPEVISDSTLAQIEALESALEGCRNLMIDCDQPPDIDGTGDVSEWQSAIDEAAKALGYPDDEV